MSTAALVQPLSVSLSWLSPEQLLTQFGGSFVWLALLLVFVECGLLFPFLPGDSLLFAVGLFIASGRVHVLGSSSVTAELVVALALLSLAALAGNLMGYEIGRRIGPAVHRHEGRLVNRALLDRTQAFLDRRGGQTLVLARFVPFVRTYITLVAGITRLDRRRFVVASVTGAVLWVSTISLLGFFLGSVPWIGDNIDVAVLVLGAFTIAPVLVGAGRRRTASGRLCG